MAIFRYNFRLILFAYSTMLLLGSDVMAQGIEKELRIPSTISHVTVFINQAQVTRTAKVSVGAGVTHLVFEKVSPYINLNSIQAKADVSLNVLSVSQRNTSLQLKEKPTYIVAVEDTLAALNHQLALLAIKKEAMTGEKEVLLANKHIGGENSGVKIEDLEDALTLFRKRIQEIGEDLLKVQQQEQRLSAIKQSFKQQLDQYIQGLGSSIEIVITVKAIQPVNAAKLEWSYLVSNTSWTPFYDIRVKDTKSQLQLVSRAFITQNTGENWENVVLKLSTTNPNEGGTKPELTPQYLFFNDAIKQSTVSYDSYQRFDAAPAAGRKEDDKQLNVSGNANVINNSAVNVEFNITSAYTIPSDNNAHQVDLTTQNLPAVYGYGAVPKLDKDAFVTAKVSGNDLINQMSGEAFIYFDGTFTGKTFINGTTADSIIISLGRDKRIQIQRVKLKDFSSKNISGSQIRYTNTWEINVRNTRKETIILVLEDQIPVSTNKEIEVRAIQFGSGVYNEASGNITWILTLEPEKTQTVKFSYEVRHPKDKILSNENN